MGRVVRRLLITMGRKSRDPHTAVGFHIVSRLGLGLSSPQVATELVVARSTVVRAATRFASEGVDGLFDKRAGNGLAKVDDAFRRAIAALLRKTPEDFGRTRPTWTRELLCLEIAAPRLADGRGLHDGSRARAPRCAPRNAEARRPLPVAARCARARSRTDSPARTARYGTRTRRVLRRGRHPPQPEDRPGLDAARRATSHCDARQERQNKKFYLAGALDVRTGRLHTTGAEQKNAALFCELLRLRANHYRRARRIHVVLDNYGIHSAHLTRDTLAELGGRVVLHFLPPYCPDANRIERVWQELHANVTRNHRCKTIGTLLGNCRRYVENYRWRRAAAPARSAGAA